MKFCLIDGSGFIFRAFHALPPLSTSSGIPVNAVYGFTKSILELRKNKNITHILVLFDAARVSFRQDIYPNYKAHRPPPPEELIPQFSLIREATTALNIDHLELEGFEADDLIASYANKAKNLNMDIEIISSDKDLMQLVDDTNNVYMFDPLKKKKITEIDVKEKFGVPPSLVVQAQALIGDSSDNIPGVKGIGPKTAAELLNTFGSLQEIYNNIDNISKPALKNNLVTCRANAEISLQLASLKIDIPNLPDIDSHKIKDIDPLKLLTFIKELSFTSLANKITSEYNIQGATPNKNLSSNLKQPNINQQDLQINHSNTNIPISIPSIFKDVNNQVIETEEDLINLLKALENETQISFFITYNKNKLLEEFEIFSPITKTNYKISLKQESHESLFDNKTTGILPKFLCSSLKDILEAPSCNKIFYNIKSFLHLLAKYGIYITNIDKDLSFDDTMLQAYLLSGVAPYNISEISFLLHNNFLKNKEDTTITATDIYNLNETLKKQLIEQKCYGLYQIYDKPCALLLFIIESNGITVNPSILNKLSKEFSSKLKDIESELFKEAGEEFNVASPKQIGELLFEKKGYKGKKNKTGSWKTDNQALENIIAEDAGQKLATLILKWRQIAKLKSTYTNSLIDQINPITKRVHGTLLQTSTSTSRLSSIDPNLQNIPIRTKEGKQIREAFVASNGYKIISLDYSQIELRILAGIANIKNLSSAFANNIDVHKKTASEIFNIDFNSVTPQQRFSAKAINFGIIYGQTEFGLATALGISKIEAKNYIDKYFIQYPEIKDYMEQTIQFARQYGYVRTIFGRKCFIKDINSNNYNLKSFAQRAAINAPIQGSEADIVKKAMLDIQYYAYEHNLPVKILLQVHDEILLEAKEEDCQHIANIVQEIMQNVMISLKDQVKFKESLVVDFGIGDTWLAAH